MKIKKQLYPIKFTPILKEKVWGGCKLSEIFNKDQSKNIGESWEISGVKDNISEVMNGSLKGKTLNQLITLYQEELVGAKVYEVFGDTFPLLFKFIDAKEDLSIQLHPNDKLAVKRHNSFGKTEMWYILEAEDEARLILGFNQEMDKETYLKYLSENRITSILHSEKVKKGDAFFIAPGTIHAIGAGVVLAEIQQTSDITYRVYDWDRPGINGELRELHNDLAIEAINFDGLNAKLDYSEKENIPVSICESSYFTTNKLEVSTEIKRNLFEIDSFVVYMCVEGSATIETLNYSESIKKGETVLIPSIATDIKIISSSATFLEVYIP